MRYPQDSPADRRGTDPAIWSGMNTRIEFSRYALVVNYLQEVSLQGCGEGLNRPQLKAARERGLVIGRCLYRVFELVDCYCVDIEVQS